MAVKLSNAAAIVACDAITALVDAGDMRVRTGAPPANGDSAATGTLLGTFTLPDPAFNGATDGNPHANALAETIADTVGVAGGAAGYFEARTSGAAVVWTGTITASGGGGDLEINDVDIVVDQVMQVVSWTFRHLES
jgi:hypothetical protein